MVGVMDSVDGWAVARFRRGSMGRRAWAVGGVHVTHPVSK